MTMTALAAGERVVPTQTRRSDFSKAARSWDRPPGGFASAKQSFVATWGRPSADPPDWQLWRHLTVCRFGAAKLADVKNA
jgi:hypothetical protein